VPDVRIWPAFLRAVVGLVWLFEAYPQLVSRDRFLGQAFISTVQSMASGNPWGFYRQFLLGVVLPHASIFSYLVLAADVLVGLCLLLGLLTPYAAFVGIFLNLNYGLASGWMTRSDYALNGLLLVAEIIIITERAGRLAGLDAALVGRPGKRPRRY
jgi:thiosulfate dehydrogenase (quinone) large subunit